MEDDLNGDTRWPIYGGIPNRIPLMEDYHVERIYVAGYRDGSVRLWDATSPALSQIHVLQPQVTDSILFHILSFYPWADTDNYSIFF